MRVLLLHIYSVHTALYLVTVYVSGERVIVGRACRVNRVAKAPEPRELS